jgi:hypothetical protein
MRRIHEKLREGVVGQLDILLADICIKFGYCSKVSGIDLAREHESLSDELFAEIILRAEGLDPETVKASYRRLKQAFRDQFSLATYIR